MMNKRQYMITYYYLGRALFLGTALSYLLDVANNGSVLSALIGAILGVLFSILLFYIIKKNDNILRLLNKGFSGNIGKLILLVIGIILLNHILVSIGTLASSFYLVNTPYIVISLGIGILIYYAINKGLNGFIRSIEILFPLSILFFLFKNLSYGNMWSLDNFKPYLNCDFGAIIKGAIIFFVNTIAPSILLLNYNNKGNFKYHIIGYLLGACTVLITIVMIIGILGFPLADLFRYPEYMILKKVSFLNFIENVENILTISLIFDSIVVGVLATKLIRDIINSWVKSEKFIKIWDGLFLIIMALISTGIFNENYANTLLLYKYEYLVLLGLISSLIIIILFKLKKS